MKTNYKKAVELLTSKDKFHIELGLGRVAKVLDSFGNPQDKLKVIHVAGTNGKGSTCAMLDSILCAEGYKTGLFTSPHLVKYTERIKVNSEEITDEQFYELLFEINEKATSIGVNLTEFEILTVAAFLYFYRQAVDFAIMEVGLGGRLDATNIVKSPMLCVITSISMDHTDRLGDTIAKIAAEKAGIIKQSSLCVVSKNNAGLVIIKNIAEKQNAQVVTVPNCVTLKNEKGKTLAFFDNKFYEVSLSGDYQTENLSLIVTILNILRQNNIKISEDAIENGLKNVKHHARFEYFKELNLVIDGAHNPDGARALRHALDNVFNQSPVTFIYATINTKDYASILKKLVKPCDELFFYEFKRENAVGISVLEKVAPPHKGDLGVVENIPDIKKILQKNLKTRQPVVLTGSLYAIGELYQKIIRLKI